MRAVSKYMPPGAYIRRGNLTEGFLRYEFGGLIHGEAYFRDFMVFMEDLVYVLKRSNLSTYADDTDFLCR